MAEGAVTFRQFVTAFTDFLTVAIHTILYERSLYPKPTFLSARKYDFIVHQSRHPKVCEWINDAIDSIKIELLKCSINKIFVVIFDDQNLVRERFVFDVARFPVVPATDVDAPLQKTDRYGGDASVLPTVDLEEQLRATMSRLSHSGLTLKPLPPGCSFTVAMDVKTESHPPIGHPQPWVPAEPVAQVSHPSNPSSPPLVRALRSVAAGSMVFEAWVEENHLP